MPFKNCACHVWAIDGYTDDDRSKEVHEQYALVGMNIRSVLNKRRNPYSDYSNRIAKLVKDCRIEEATEETCTIYGGFGNEFDGSPVHMWLEYGGYIYDTVPGQKLYRVPADHSSRISPGAYQVGGVDSNYLTSQVGRFESTLTVTQRDIIAAANLAIDAAEEEKQEVAIFDPTPE